jgi:transcriptional regulator with XRE-family HTH domain
VIRNAFTYSGELREDNDIKQEVLARELNVTQSAYSRYETGAREVPHTVIIRLADYYNTSTDYLLGITDERTAYKRVGGDGI